MVIYSGAVTGWVEHMYTDILNGLDQKFYPFLNSLCETKDGIYLDRTSDQVHLSA